MQFSVSMSVYKNDKPEYFREALESVINQTVQPDEIVLVVDGPIPDDIKEVIVDFQKRCNFFKTIWLEENMGHGYARRTGLTKCTHELVAIMDSDDLCLPDRFEKQLQCFKEDKDLSLVGGQIQEFIDNVSNVVGIRDVPLCDQEIREYLKQRCPFNQMTVMFKKSDVFRAGGYLDWYCNEDYYLWIRMYQKGAKFKNLEDCLVYVRVGEEMYQRRGGWRYFESEAKLQKYMRNQGINNIFTFVNNVAIRFILQVLMPNKVRGFVFKKFARKKAGPN